MRFSSPAGRVQGKADEAFDILNDVPGYLRRYFPTLFELPFQAEQGSRSLLEALTIVRRLDHGELWKLPLSAPVDFVPSVWRKFLLRGDGSPGWTPVDATTTGCVRCFVNDPVVN